MKPTLIVASAAIFLSLALAGTASAQTSFQASITAHDPLPKPCPNNEFLCGTAKIENHGPATWTFTITSLTIQGTCANYQAAVTFELADSSTLVLDENGTACGPGNSALAAANSYGTPTYATGDWSVQSADGQFAGIAGAGTDALHIAGANASGSYTGLLSQ